eukprot:Opistho-1_new@23614
MSYQLLKEDILFYQRFLKANGYYTAKLDGKWGPKTDAADTAFLAESNRIGTDHGFFDARSEANIITLVPKAQVLVRKFLQILTAAGFDIRIISGTRTYAEQNALYRKGRYGSTDNKVTNARGGQSNHNFGTAWDIGLFENGKYITDDKKYKLLAPLVTSPLPELEWGGHWPSFPDFPHYQHRTTVTSVSSVRHLFEAGEVYV